MSLSLSEVKTEAEFDEVVKLEYLAYGSPFNSLWEILKGPNIDTFAKNQWSRHVNTPGSHWLKVTDGNGIVIGAAQWIVHEKNPYENPMPEVTATWWPEGHLRNISEQMLTQFLSVRTSVMNSPHVLLNICCVHPGHRRRGAASLLMRWGCNLADEMGLESFLESTVDGRKLYTAYGFVIVRPFFLDPVPAIKEQAEDPEWIEVKNEIVPEPHPVWLMWRPREGKYEEGKTKFPGET